MTTASAMYREMKLLIGLCSLVGAAALAADGLPLRERFNNNKNEWNIDSGENWEEHIEDGALRLHNVEGEKWSFVGREIDYDKERDLQVSFEATFIEGDEDCSFGFSLANTSDWENYLDIGAKEEGVVYVGSNRDDVWHLHQPNLKVDAYRKGEANRFVFKRIDAVGYVFLNDQIVLIFPDERKRGDVFQFQVEGGASVAFDNLTIEYIEKPDPQIAAYYEAYETFKDANGIDPMREEFVDNSGNWIPEEEPEKWFAEIDEGVLVMENLNLDSTSANRRDGWVSIDPLRNYELSCRIRYMGGTDNKLIGFTWGSTSSSDDRSGFNRFGIAANGYYMIDRYHEDGWDTPVDWTKSEAVNTGEAWNELTIRKIGDRAYYFVNGAIVANLEALEWYGDRMGWNICYDATVGIDYLRAEYLDMPPRESAQLAASYESDLRARRIAAAGPLEPIDESFEGGGADWRWLENGETKRAEVQDGSFFWENSHPKKNWYQVIHENVSVNSIADFRYEMRVRNNGGATNRSIDLKLGAGDASCRFGITFDGHLRYLSEVDEEQSTPFAKSDAIRKDGWNRVEIRKIDESLFLLINDELVAVRRADKRFGPELALVNNYGLKVEIDEVSLTYPQLDDEERTAEKEQYHEYIVENRLKYRRDGTWVEPPFLVKARLKDAFNEDKKIQRTFERFKKRYRNKTLAHVIADKGQAREKRGSRHYFYLGNVGQMGWFVEVHAINLPGKPRNNDPRNYGIHDSMGVVSSYELYGNQ